jgi:hypothetical protein
VVSCDLRHAKIFLSDQSIRNDAANPTTNRRDDCWSGRASNERCCAAECAAEQKTQ